MVARPLILFYFYLFSPLFRLRNSPPPSHRPCLLLLHSVGSVPELVLSVTASFNSKISIWFFFKSFIIKAEAFLFFHVSSMFIITCNFLIITALKSLSDFKALVLANINGLFNSV